MWEKCVLPFFEGFLLQLYMGSVPSSPPSKLHSSFDGENCKLSKNINMLGSRDVTIWRPYKKKMPVGSPSSMGHMTHIYNFICLINRKINKRRKGDTLDLYVGFYLILLKQSFIALIYVSIRLVLANQVIIWGVALQKPTRE